MSALSAGKTRRTKGGVPAVIIEMQAAVDIFYQGAMICTDTDVGNAEPATNAATKKFIGICTEKVDNSAGSAGDLTVPVHTGLFVERLVIAAAAQTDVGSPVYCTDDNLVTTTAGAGTVVGLIVEFISATEVGVLLNPHGAVGS